MTLPSASSISSSSNLSLTSSGRRDVSIVLSAIIYCSNHVLNFICHFPHLWITVAIFSLNSRLNSRHTYRTLVHFAPSSDDVQREEFQSTEREMSIFHFPFLRGNDGYNDLEYTELQVDIKLMIFQIYIPITTTFC